MKIFCYRDNLEGDKYKYYGVTLYFVAGKEIEKDPLQVYDVLKALGSLKNEGKLIEISQRIERILDEGTNPIIDFVNRCIELALPKTPCYNAAKRSHQSIRKDVNLALHDYLTYKKNFEETNESVYEEIKRNDYYYEMVQDHFAEQLYKFMGMGYETSGLSECEAPTDVREGDFIFEIGRLQSAKLQYFGHYRPGGHGWLNLRIFDDFDIDTLEAIIDDNT